MEVEIHVDRAACCRHRRGMFAFLLAVVMFIPTVLLALALLATLLGRETIKPYTGAAVLAGFAVVMAVPLYGTWHSLRYRCPRCGRRLPRVVPLGGRTETNIRFGCADCRVVWDLGWRWGEKG
jgi:hypothetical protein